MEVMHLRSEDFDQRNGCPSCDAGSWSRLSKQTAFANYESLPIGQVDLDPIARGGRELRRCLDCDLWYMSIVPSQATVRRILDQPGLSKRWTSKGTRGTFDRAHRALAAYVGNCGDILDVGAHTGGFLSTLGGSWVKTALEPMASSSTGISRARVVPSFLEDAELHWGKHDCITAFDVLEHLHRPDDAIRTISLGLRSGGIALFETGTTDATAARILRSGWYYLNHVEHFQAFNITALSRLLERHGMGVVEYTRVYHADFTATERARELAHVLAFAALTGGGRTPKCWQLLSHCASAPAAAFPPRTMSLERDHMFVVARKRVPGDA